MLQGKVLPHQDWKASVDQSDVFIVMGSESYFHDPVCFDQALYAKKIGKKFLVILVDDITIPKNFPIGKVLATVQWRTEEGSKILAWRVSKILEKAQT